MVYIQNKYIFSLALILNLFSLSPFQPKRRVDPPVPVRLRAASENGPPGLAAVPRPGGAGLRAPPGRASEAAPAPEEAAPGVQPPRPVLTPGLPGPAGRGPLPQGGGQLISSHY